MPPFRLISRLLSKNLPFAVYRLPGTGEITFLVQLSQQENVFQTDKLANQKGFIIAPFDAYKTGEIRLIKPDIVAGKTKEYQQLLAAIDHLPDQETSFLQEQNFFIDKPAYLQQVKQLVGSMKKGKAAKVVLSRVLKKPLPSAFDFDTFFEQMEEKYPAAFVYFFHIPGEGYWAGATPETLLKQDDGFLETMALAGTRKLSSGKQMQPWGQKEKEEQAFVTEFVEKQIQNLGIENYEKRPVETLLAGNLAHLCTRFRFAVKGQETKTGLFAKALHPTPAVGGLPQRQALQLIEKTEKHRRHYYTGFLGPWQVKNQQHLFVNLRCARFLGNSMEIYAGGGLTPASLPEKEWQETEDKAQTLLSVVEKLRNFAP